MRVASDLSAEPACYWRPAVTPINRAGPPDSIKLIRPVPRTITRPLSLLVLVAWVVCMAVLVNRSYLQASPANLATDLARYGPTATWRGVYYRGEKIGFTVSQMVRTGVDQDLAVLPLRLAHIIQQLGTHSRHPPRPV